jgi:VWFA-related protein
MRHKKLIIKTFVVIVLAAITTAAQDYQIRTRVDLVVVPVTVKGSGGNIVSGLTKADFRIYENGKEQQISNFTIDPIPLSAAVLVDTGLSPKTFQRIQKTLTALNEAFSPFDEVAVYRFNTYVARLSDFSTNKDALQATLSRLKDITPVSMMDSVDRDPFSSPSPLINGMPVAPSLQFPAGGPPKDVKILHDAIFAVADDLRKRAPERRRVLLVVSDGRTGGNDHTYDQVVNRLLENNIQVYSIGMDLAFLARQLSILDKYSKATGGDSFFLNATDSLERAYARAAEEARNQYVLGYFSSNEVSGSLPVFREIDVQTVPSGLRVLHRRGYYQYPR